MRASLVGLVVTVMVAASCGASATPSPSPTATATPTVAPGASVAPVVTGSQSSAPTVTPTRAPATMPTATPTPTLPPTPAPTATPTLAPTAGPTATPTPITTGHWESAGAMALGRAHPYIVPLGDGSVLVAGNDDLDCVRADSVGTEIWTPSTGEWSAGPSLNSPRADFAAVAVADGAALVTGGLNAGIATEFGQDRHQSYSSTYAYDPLNASAGWSRTGLLDHARTLPAAASLPDGRVLVAGGYYLDGAESGATAPAANAVLAAYHCAPGTGPAASGPTPSDVTPPTIVPALATAELYDPATGSWSATGPLRYARVGAAAVTLADGRVLVVGSAPWTYQWNYTQPKIDDRAYESAEIYDPHTGRFSLAGSLPPVDVASLAKLGAYRMQSQEITSAGTLVALADGGALLVGRRTDWYTDPDAFSGSTTRTLRFDPGTGRWTQIDQTMVASPSIGQAGPEVQVVRGHSRPNAVAVRLGDGRVLVAGGSDEVSSSADLYDPVTDSWSALPPMPEGRGESAAVLLADGSVLIVGGRGAKETCRDTGDCDCGKGPTGLATAVRFVPGP